MKKYSYLIKIKLCVFVSLCLCVYFLLWKPPTYAQDKIVAIVNSDVITQKDLDDFVNFMRIQLATEYKGEKLESKIQSMKLDLLDKLIEDRLILQKAKKNNIKIDENMVSAKVDEIKKRYASDKEFQNTLYQQGLSQTDIETRVKDQLLMYNIINSQVRSKIVINPGEITDFYQRNTEEFSTPEEREFESVTMNDKDLAKKISTDLKNTQDLKTVAEKYGLPVNSLNAKKGQELRKDIEEVIFKLKPGDISEPIAVDENFYIFKLVNITGPRQQNLSEVQEKISTFLFEKKLQEELANWLDELKKKAYIKIFSD